MITSELKDHILNELVEAGIHFSFNINSSKDLFQINRDQMELILDQFVDYHFINMNKMLGGAVYITLTAYAFDFVQKGGFTAKESLEKAALEKLQLELESLKKSFPEKADLITSVLANIATVAGLFITR